MSRRIGLTLAVAAALALAGCGKKPRSVDSPDVERAQPFPQTYPNPNLDPKPGQPSSGLKFP
ncbi:hypothetical protein [Azospirillum sp.]|uniref:hypothetical protein n=1 Tax=Azospirillum sp. TaxID=34012 RepID=UPI003D75745B